MFYIYRIIWSVYEFGTKMYKQPGMKSVHMPNSNPFIYLIFNFNIKKRKKRNKKRKRKERKNESKTKFLFHSIKLVFKLSKEVINVTLFIKATLVTYVYVALY